MGSGSSTAYSKYSSMRDALQMPPRKLKRKDDAMTSTKLTVETHVAAPLQEIWRAWNAPDDIKQWNAASDDWHTTKSAVDLRVGGTFSARMEAKDGSMGFDFAGTYTKVVEHKLIESTFGDRVLLVEFIPDTVSRSPRRPLAP